MSAVHPHVCGETVESTHHGLVGPGSPPRVWGNGGFVRGGRKAYRFTPTCVGKRRFDDVRRTEIRFTPTCVGKRIHPPEDAVSFRFTPTCVGKREEIHRLDGTYAVHPHVCGETSHSTRRQYTATAVHPHVCGETWPLSANPSRRLGSPPRVWGNVCPAHCGLLGSPVHPHVCGETGKSRHARPAVHGSPPRVWGNGTQWLALRFFGSVHPHVCGETWPLLSFSFAICGSPPRVWGNGVPSSGRSATSGSPPRVWGNGKRSGRCWSCCRFTPTCVGKRGDTTQLSDLYYSVHPHVCGETENDLAAAGHAVGSPPRVWGNGETRRSSAISTTRFTPTCVGKRLDTPPA